MIQFNLLPDIKLEYVRAQKTKRTITTLATLVTGSALAIMVVFFLGVQLQNRHINNLTNDIADTSTKLEGIDDLDRILTVQSQLNTLGELHDGKPVMSRLQKFIDQFTPAQVSYAEINIDLELNTMTLTGSADSIRTVNKFVDTIKFTEYKQLLDGEEVADDSQQLAFKNVVLASFGKDDKGTSYEITLEYDPVIFSSEAGVQLIVKEGLITTRSSIEKPDSIIQELKNSEEGVE
jgi:Tfp pilus assembly protein PilN